MATENVNGGSNEHVKKNPSSSSPSSPSSISSSSSSSLEFDTGNKSNKDGHNLSRSGSVSSQDITPQTPQWSIVSASSRSGMSLHSSQEFSQIKSPMFQAMGRTTGHDPNRIPSSIFSTKPTTPTDWSVASNESLFSIHMGNNSFTRDNAILFGKSGELPWLDDRSSVPPTLPPVTKVLPVLEESSVKSPKVAKETPALNLAKEKINPAKEENFTYSTLPSPPRLSNESGNSSKSFAFPVLVCDSGKTAGSLKADVPVEKPQFHSQVSEATPKASDTSWFSSFSCWPRCC